MTELIKEQIRKGNPIISKSVQRRLKAQTGLDILTDEQVKALPHIWTHSPHYADIGYWKRRGSKVYWWCSFCEEHAFQRKKPEDGICLLRQSRSE